jgi:hypothetical protein
MLGHFAFQAARYLRQPPFSNFKNEHDLSKDIRAFLLPQILSIMAQASDPAPSLNENVLDPPTTIHPYLQAALNHSSVAGTVSLFNYSPTPTTYPPLLPSTTNQILLYPGSFDPPHQVI